MTNSRRRGDSTLLVTFCNVGPDKPSVAALDLRRAHPEAEWIDIKAPTRPRGARGLCFWRDLVVVAHEPGPKTRPPAPGFVLLDPRRGFEQADEGKLPSVPQPVCARDGDLYFTMSREDSVYRATRHRWRGWKASRHWTVPGSAGTDENHLNAIELVDGNLCVSGIGRPAEGRGLWASAVDGFVYDLDRGDFLMRDVTHPHLLLEHRGVAWTCETRSTRVRSVAGDEYRLPGGPESRIRGLAIGDEHLYVGVSKDRVGSLSRRTLEGHRGACLIYRVARGSGEAEVLIDLSEARDEIYELMLV